jgi:hypothetical protein
MGVPSGKIRLYSNLKKSEKIWKNLKKSEKIPKIWKNDFWI